VGTTSNLAVGVVVPMPTRLLGEIARTEVAAWRILVPAMPVTVELKDNFRVGAEPSQASVQALNVSQVSQDLVRTQVLLEAQRV